MYAGHFAAALALKAAEPRAPTWGLVLGSGLLDIAFGGLVALGIEGFSPDYRHDHLFVIPWSHTLASAAVLGAAFAACFWRRGWRVALALFAAVISHWALDLLVHRPDLALWPDAPLKFGYYEWFGPVSGWAETVLVIVFAAVYVASARTRATHGRHWEIVCAVLAIFWTMGLSAG